MTAASGTNEDRVLRVVGNIVNLITIVKVETQIRNGDEINTYHEGIVQGVGVPAEFS